MFFKCLFLFFLFTIHAFALVSLLPPLVSEHSLHAKPFRQKIFKDAIRLPSLMTYEETSEQDEEKTISSTEKWDWTKSYKLVDGTIITHYPDRIVQDSTKSKIANKLGLFPQSGTRQFETEFFFYVSQFNGYVLKDCLYLSVYSEEREFEIALWRSGLYNPPLTKQAEFNMCGQWTETLAFSNGTIIQHTPKEFILNSGMSNEIRTNEIFLKIKNGIRSHFNWNATPQLLESEFRDLIEASSCFYFPCITYSETFDLLCDTSTFSLTLKNGFVLSRNAHLICLKKPPEVQWGRYFEFKESITNDTLMNVERCLLNPKGSEKYLSLYQNAPLEEIKNALIAFPDLYEGTEEERDNYHYSANWVSKFKVSFANAIIKHTPYEIIIYESEGRGFKRIGSYQKLDTRQFFGVGLRDTLCLDVKSTYSQFVRALRISGLIK